ncbi:MAG: hypothetical protein WC934_06350 [Acidithiobacillus sp.]|jgi:hypothetical protein
MDYYYFLTYHFIGLSILTFVLSNPDLDQLLDISDLKSFFTETHEMDNHRSFFTHSILLPIVWYALIRYYLDSSDSIKLNEFGLALFLPVLIHLLADYQVGHLIGLKGTSGTWLITLHPLDKIVEKIVNGYIWMYNHILKPKKLRKYVNYKSRLTKFWSFMWIWVNIICIVIYVVIKFL